MAEHARPDPRGFETSWINMMGTGGLALSLLFNALLVVWLVFLPR